MSERNFVHSATPSAVPAWLTATAQIPTATEADLLRSLLTADGRGSQFKGACVDELMRRAGAGKDREGATR